MASGEVYRDLGEAAWTWVLGSIREDEGPWLPEVVPGGAPLQPAPAADRDSMYVGIAGLAPVLAEIRLARAWSADEQRLATGIVDRLSGRVPDVVEPSLCDGLAGMAMALRLLSPGSEQEAVRRLAELMTSQGWPSTLEMLPGSVAPVTDLLLGTAGVVLTALWAGGDRARDVAATGGEALLEVAEPTPTGLDWAMLPGYRAKMPNYSHGTAGVAAALATAGAALGRDDFVDAARQGAQHLLDIGSLADGGFEVPHTVPRSSRPVDPVTYSWCHGPTGTSYLFAALARAGVQEVGGFDMLDLRQRCLHAVMTAGVPQRLRPGFWDNDGRCCGTAGVGDVLLDAAQDSEDPARADALLADARTMADALVERAIRDDTGARWRFIEHRADPPLLPPGTSWMQGAAGIAAFLLRFARVLDAGLEAPVVDRPDQWWAVPAALRTAHTEGDPTILA